ncbi:MAG TPA: hypothetical protein VHM89_16465 [Acidimicrobiales bacterium]|nr:hypothetical protein [Acidimicrobiales bacterium]
MVTVFAALAVHEQGAVPPLEAEVLDVRPEGLGDAQTVEGQQRGQGVGLG